MTNTGLRIEINDLPKELRTQIEDFINFLKLKQLKTKLKIEKREYGFAKGKIRLADDFDKPLEDFQDYM